MLEIGRVYRIVETKANTIAFVDYSGVVAMTANTKGDMCYGQVLIERDDLVRIGERPTINQIVVRARKLGVMYSVGNSNRLVVPVMFAIKEVWVARDDGSYEDIRGMFLIPEMATDMKSVVLNIYESLEDRLPITKLEGIKK